jgi:hypothetical protein
MPFRARALRGTVAAVGIVIGTALTRPACSTSPDCTRSVAQACAADYACVTDWPSDATAFCSLPGTSLSTQDCGPYHVLDASQNEGGFTRYYYAINTGTLDAIVSFDTSGQIEGCRGGPSDLAVSRCGATGTQIVCPSTDAGAGGGGGAGGGMSGGGGSAGSR